IAAADEHADRDELARLQALCDPSHKIAGNKLAEVWDAMLAGAPAAAADLEAHNLSELAAALAIVRDRDDLASRASVSQNIQYIAGSQLEDLVTPWTILAAREPLANGLPVSPDHDDTPRTGLAALDSPDATMAAELLGLHAAGAWARRGDLAHARASLAAAIALADRADPNRYPNAHLLAAPYQHLLGDL